MPHQQCSVCRHPKREEIDAALAGLESVRAVAKRFGISPAAADRHHHHDDNKKKRMNTADLTRIDAEIRKLHFAQTAARKRRDNTVALQIARELRSWFTLRVKASAVSQANQVQQNEEIGRVEAIAMARLLIESEVAAGSAETVAWLHALLERVQHVNTSAAEHAPSEPAEPAET